MYPPPPHPAPPSPSRWWRSSTAVGLFGAVLGAVATVAVGGVASWQAERTYIAEQRVAAYSELLAVAYEAKQKCLAAVFYNSRGVDPLPDDLSAQAEMIDKLSVARAKVDLVGSFGARVEAKQVATEMCIHIPQLDNVDNSFDVPRHAERLNVLIDEFQTIANQDLNPGVGP